MALTQVDQGLLNSYAQYTGFKNRIFNGQMQIDQRNAGASVSVGASTVYPVDRFNAYSNVGSGHTAQRSTTAPSGFTNSLVFTVGTGAAPTAAQISRFTYNIEGLNVSDLAFGTASAQTITLSFWTRSSVTGTHSGAIGNNDFTRCYVFTYTISSANTWEYKTITIPGDTSGTWLTDTSAGLVIRWNLGTGSNQLIAAGSWGTTNAFGATGSVQIVATSGATFYLTGVQLEKGSTATSFDVRSYGQELILCQRYYYTSGTSNYGIAWYSSAAATSEYILAMARTPTSMRAAPTVGVYFDGVSGKIGYMTSTASFAATATNVYGSAGYADGTIAVNLYGVSARGIRGDYTASAEL